MFKQGDPFLLEVYETIVNRVETLMKDLEEKEEKADTLRDLLPAHQGSESFPFYATRPWYMDFFHV